MQGQANVLDLFNSIVVKESKLTGAIDTSLVSIGVVTDFPMTPSVSQLLQERFKPLPIKTLFTRTERLTESPLALITKQILHYIEVYGLGMPGLFDLEVVEGVVIKPTFVKGITRDELEQKVQALLYSNAPIARLEPVVEIIRDFGVNFDFAKILNNEARIHLYDPKVHKFTNGDDAIRYMVFKATESSLVIKNAKVIEKIKAATIDPAFFTQNEDVLAEVFNRFKPLILAAKKPQPKPAGAFAKLAKLQVKQAATVNTAINRIARKSKTQHKPVHEGFNKRFLALGIAAIKNGTFDNFSTQVDKLGVRDKFKILNLVEYKAQGYSVDSFVVRNGTVHVEPKRPILDTRDLDFIRQLLLESLARDYKAFMPNTGVKILLDARVDYGLPISRKQTLGNLPFGTLIAIDGTISSGVYWENDWGARDLDLSTVDITGQRTGWGGGRGYYAQDIIFSGDVTHAHDGAMEFMTSTDKTYGLFVNIFSGDQNAECELIVGSTTDKRWMDNVVVREKTKLTGRGSVIGFVEGTNYKVFQGKLNDRIANFGETSPVIKRATAPTWTVRKLFDAIGVAYDTVAVADVKYDYSLGYEGFSLDKLEHMLYK